MSRNHLKYLKQSYSSNLMLFQCLAFIMIVLVTSRLYDINNDINYLKHVSDMWLPNITVPIVPATDNLKQSSYLNSETSPFIENTKKVPLKSPFSPQLTSFKSPSILSSAAAENDQFVTSVTTELTTQIDTIQREIDFAKARLAFFHVENLRKDVELLIVELWSSRTTLMLCIVFIFVYIISWAWMAHAIQDTKNSKDVTLKTVLLLAIFSAVDIAASAGFVMIRLILYSMKDFHFPSEMRIPSAINEYQQLTAFSALRFSALRSTSGSIDIFASLIIGLLICIRIYGVITAITFYSRVKKIFSQENYLKHTINDTLSDRTNKDYDFLKRISCGNNGVSSFPISTLKNSFLQHLHYENSNNHLNENILTPNLNGVNLNNVFNNVINQTAAKALINNQAINLAAAAAAAATNLNNNRDARRFSITTSILSDEENQIHPHSMLNIKNQNLDNTQPKGNLNHLKTATPSLNQTTVENQIKIQAADMPLHMQKIALQSASNAIQMYMTEKHIAENIKQDFDNQFEPTWHCIVGRNWGSCVTHSKQCYIRMVYKDLTILLYKST